MKREEIIKKIVLIATATTLYAITMATYIHALSNFLTELGAEMLPYMLIAVALFVMVHALSNAVLSARFRSYKIFAGTILFFMANYGLLQLFQAGTPEHTFYFAVIAGLMLWLQELTVTHFINSLVTPLQAKSYLPLAYSFMSAGMVAGALFALPYQEVHEALGIGSIPLGVLLVILGLIWGISKLFKHEINANFAGVERTKVVEGFKQSAAFVFKDSRLFRSLAVVIVLFVGVHLLVEFKFKAVLASEFGHEQLTEMLGLAYVAANILIWIMSSLVVKRALFRFGVSNMLLFYAFSVLIALGVVVALGFHYIAVIALFLTYAMSHFSYYNICTGQILSAVPKHLHESVFFFVRGFLYAAALLFFAVSLLVYTFRIELEQTLNTVVLASVLGFLLFQLLRQKVHYFKQLKTNLFMEDEFLKLRSIDLLAEEVSQKQGEDHLRRMLGMEKARNVKSRIIGSLGAIGNYQTIVDLAKIVKTDDPKIKVDAVHAINQIIKKGEDLRKYPVTKHFLLRTYEGVLVSDVPSYVKSEVINGLKYFDLEDVITFLEENLKSDSEIVSRNSIRTLASFNDRGIIPYLEPFLDCEDCGQTAEAIVGLWQFEQMRIILLPRISGMVRSRRKGAAVNSLYIIGSIKATWEKEFVMKKLKSGKLHVRVFALITLILLGERDWIDDFVKQMLQLAKRGDTKELEFALSWYRRFDDSVKAAIIMNIQGMDADDVSYFVEAFKCSKYAFSDEVYQLT